MGKNIVVTGASGLIGYHVARQLISLGYEVRLLIRQANRNIDDLESRGARACQVDFTDPDSFRELLSDVDVLFHLASENTSQASDEPRVLDNTYGLTKLVLDTAIKAGVKTVIYTSSVVVLGRSSDENVVLDENSRASSTGSPYIKGKCLAESYCDDLINSGLIDIRRLYPAWVLGSNDCKLTPSQRIITDYVKKGQKFYFAGGLSIASVDEVAKAHINAWLIGKPNEKYVVAGDNISYREFYATMAACAGHTPPRIKIPKWAIFCAAYLGKIFLGKHNPVDPNHVNSVIGNFSWYSSDKAKRELDYSPPSSALLLKQAVVDAGKRINNLYYLENKHAPIKKMQYEEDDLLLITGFPGWLGNRMIDVLMNGDRNGNFSVRRKIRLLVQPKYEGMVSLPANFEIVYGDITDKRSLLTALKGVKSVYHLAGVIYPKHLRTFYEVNYMGTKNVVDACIESGVRRMLIMGSDTICGYGRAQRIFDSSTEARPYKQYGRSKYLAEKYLLDKTDEGLIDGTSLRGFWFFGPFMPERKLDFFRMFYWKRQIMFGNGKNYRSISHVDNVIQAFLKAEKRRETFGKWYWIGDKKADYTVEEIYKTVAETMGVTYRPVHIPNLVCELMNVADTVISWFGRINPTLNAAGKAHKDVAGDCGAAEKDFDYNPDVDFKEINNELNQLVNLK